MTKCNAMNTFAHNVTRILAAKGLTHADLAEELGMERTHVSRALRGANSPRWVFVENVATALEVDIRDLFEPIPEKISA
jgi:transcriptional regulator with XRE-family HTH domain